jgi:hypothetical protein
MNQWGLGENDEEALYCLGSIAACRDDAAVTLDALLAEIRSRARTLPPPEVDPWRAIRLRCSAQPETLENQTLMRIMTAIREGHGDFDDADIWALGQEALGLVQALIERKTPG